MQRYVVARTSEVPAGKRKLVHVAGRDIVLINAGGEYFALMNRCPHQGGSLLHGDLIGLVESSGPGHFAYSRRGEMLRCAWHGWEFDIRTGQSYCDPRRFRVKAYPVNVEPGTNLVKGPYVAETIAVSVESDYVVVDL